MSKFLEKTLEIILGGIFVSFAAIGFGGLIAAILEVVK
jgi:hypothetical protein